MKINSLANKILKSMLKQYNSHETECFSPEDILPLLNCTKLDFENAVELLSQQESVLCTYADDEISVIRLLPKGILQAQNNTMSRKLYSVLKEIRNLLP